MEGLAADDYATMLAEVMLQVLGPEVRQIGRNIQANQFGNPAAALKLHAAASVRMAQHATLYEDLSATRRARAHRQIAEAMEELYEDRPGSRVGELARHRFNATQPIDLAKAIRYSRRAADEALAALAPGDALRCYSRAIGLHRQVDHPDPAEAIDLAIGLGVASALGQVDADRVEILEMALDAAPAGNPDRALVPSASSPIH